MSQAAPSTSPGASSRLYCVSVQPDLERCALIDRALAAEQAVWLEVRMEVLAVDEHGKALLWVEDQHRRRPPRLSSVQLGAARRAELLVAEKAGRRAVLVMRLQVLGKRKDGAYTAVSHQPEGELVLEAKSPSDEAELAALLGNERRELAA